MALDKIDIDTLDSERTIVVATGNAHKLTEIEAILGAVLPEVRFVALGQLGDFEDPEENGTTFVENASSRPRPPSRRRGSPLSPTTPASWSMRSTENLASIPPAMPAFTVTMPRTMPSS